MVGNELLLEALKVEVAAVAEEGLAVRLIADIDGVAAQEVEEVGEEIGGAVGDAGRLDGGWSDEAVAVEAREEIFGV